MDGGVAFSWHINRQQSHHFLRIPHRLLLHNYVLCLCTAMYVLKVCMFLGLHLGSAYGSLDSWRVQPREERVVDFLFSFPSLPLLCFPACPIEVDA